ncbi:MAG: MATE family efflux transporter [Bacteroidales bacterium]|nr:MATE family efflux transporter [Bacteroidales bacterium]
MYKIPEIYLSNYKKIIRLGTPIVIGQLGNIILGFIDTIMVGQYSADTLSASGFVNNLFNLGIISLLGFSYGATPIIGAYFGRKENDNVGASFKDSLWANSLAGLIIFCIYTIIYFNLHNLGQPEELLPLMRPYFLILLLSLPFTTLFNALKQFTDTVAATKTAMWVIMIGNIINIILNYLLIYGISIFPELGLTGAGVATLVARMTMVAMFVIFITREKKFKPYGNGFIQRKIEKKEIKKLVKIGTPLALQMGMETASFSLASILMGWLGATQLAAYQVMCIVGSLCFLVYYGIAAASSIRISHYKGRGDWSNVKITADSAFHIIMAVAIVLSIGIALTQNHLARLFTSDTAIQTMFASLLIPMLAYQISDGIQINYSNALRGIAVTKPLMAYAFIAYICISLPASYLFGFTMRLGAIGVALGLPFGLTTAAILYYYRFRKEINKHSVNI